MEWLEVLLMCVLNDEWEVDTRSKSIVGCCGNGMKKGEKKRESCRISEWNFEAFTRATRSLDQCAQAEIWICSSDHFFVWVRSSELESAQTNLILDRALIEAENLANRPDLTVRSIGGLHLSPVGFGVCRRHWCFLGTYMSSKLAWWLINANREFLRIEPLD